MEKDVKIPAFGPVLREYRLAAGLSQEELGARLGYETANYISCLELGTRKPSLELLFKISKALNIAASELVSAMEKSI